MNVKTKPTAATVGQRQVSGSFCVCSVASLTPQPVLSVSINHHSAQVNNCALGVNYGCNT